MSRRYSFEAEPPPPPHNQQPCYDPPQQQYQAYQPQPQPHSQSPPLSPAAHPDSTFNRMQAERRLSPSSRQQTPPVNPFIAQAPAPPPHRGAEGRFWGRELGYNTDADHNISPGADNFIEQASGGMVGLASGVANENLRQSGVEAMRHIYTPGYHPSEQDRVGQEYGYGGEYEQSPYLRPEPRLEQSQSSLQPLGAAAFPPGMATPSRSEISRSERSFIHESYADNPSHLYSRNLDPALEPHNFDPNSIEDDGDDGLEYSQRKRNSMLSLGHHSDRSGALVAAAAGGAAAGGVLGAIGGLVGRKTAAGQGGQQYNTVSDPYAGSAGNYNLGPEKSEWLHKQSSGNKKLRWLVIILITLVILGGIAGGIVGGTLSSRNNKNVNNTTPNGQSASDDSKTNGDLTKDSAEIKALLNNKNLHKVFPGMDYTPMYTQYPDCLHYPASQNNVTRDLAVLSQLTNTVRLYGTDCNQTELLLHSIDQLGLNGTIKVWMGVWLDTNTTTNARQMAQMYDIFSTHGSASFAGVIVGNEVLYREDMTATELGTVIASVKTNLTAMGIDIPVASSDLGDNWSANPSLAAEVDILMANIHPFFAGVTASAAAAWTWNFWQTHDLILKSDLSQNYISETGWPSTGGTDCGGAASCTGGSVAGVDEMSAFMEGWVCPSLVNGTNYFWFEAFDEPWKIKYNTVGKEWEDKWGLLDVNRNLKSGVTIPSCGGKTV